MENKILHLIFSSDKIHLTQSQKNFIKETYEILSIFDKNVDKLFLQNFNQITETAKNKFHAGNFFYKNIYKLRYPVSWQKLAKLKKFKKYNFEFDEKSLSENLSEIDIILNQL